MGAEARDAEDGSQCFYSCQGEKGMGHPILFASCVTSVDGESTDFASSPGRHRRGRLRNG